MFNLNLIYLIFFNFCFLLQAIAVNLNIEALTTNSKNFQPIRIKYIYLQAQYFNRTGYPNSINITDVNQTFLNNFETNILQNASNYLQGVINLFPVIKNFYLNESSCPNLEPTDYKDGISNYDLVVLYLFQYDNITNFRATSAPCQIYPEYFDRPVLGMTIFNLKFLGKTLIPI